MMFMVHVKFPSSLLAVSSYLSESFVLRGTEALNSDDLRLQEKFGGGLPSREYKFRYETNEVPFFGDQSLQRYLICGLSEKERKHWKHKNILIGLYFLLLYMCGEWRQKQYFVY